MRCMNCTHRIVCEHETKYRKQCMFFEEKRPHGEWLECEDNNYRKCSHCGIIVMSEEADDFDFCPNCGADMRKRGEAE